MAPGLLGLFRFRLSLFLGEINAKLIEISEDLNFKMSQPINAQSGNHAASQDIDCKKNTKPAQKYNGNTKPSLNSLTSTSHQVQYCGPYKLEKTLGKGQTG